MRLALTALFAALGAASPSHGLAQTAPVPASTQAYDAEGWVADLHRAREAMGSHYANLDWAVVEREAPLAQLFLVGEQRLRAAGSDAEAREVFERLEEFLGDGHLEFVWPSARAAAATGDQPPAQTRPAAEARPPCAVLGFQSAPRDGGALASRLPGYRPLDGDSGFPAGIVEIEGRKVGVIRIAQMSAQAHPLACDAAFAAMTLPAGQACGDDCLDNLRTLATDRVTEGLIGRIRSLEAAGAEVLLVDLAGNGGGSEWAEVAARLFTPVRLKSARVGFPRHPHWVERFARDEQRLADAARGQPREDRRLLDGYAAVFAQARREAETPCDPAPWFTSGGRPDCAWLTTAPLYATGPVAELDPALAGKPWAAEVFTPLRYHIEPGVWNGPLLVLVDGRTGSAAEQFAAVLQDNNAAVVVGSPTAGAGCGHARGEIETILPHSGARLRLPNCARLRADGRNEVSGVDPDVLVGFRDNDGAARRIERLQARAPEAVRQAQALAARPR